MAMPRPAFVNAVGTAVPDHDIHRSFLEWAERRVDGRELAIFRRMAGRSGITRRWSVLPECETDGRPTFGGGFYGEASPSTATRMRVYAKAAPALALQAIAELDRQTSVQDATHLVVASCTGFVAPGIDQIIASRLGLHPDVERTLVGFMGCYAAVAALRAAYHIVRSEPGARVLVVTVELSTLHLQYTDDVEELLAMMQFGDGAAAALVSAEPKGIRLSRPFAAAIPGSEGLIRWTIGDTGFSMHLSGAVAGHIATALQDPSVRYGIFGRIFTDEIDTWAVHAGGRSILDAVQRALDLPDDALQASRAVLSAYGNMSSSTLMFVLAGLLGLPDRRRGLALAFGPGLAAEGFHFERVAERADSATLPVGDLATADLA